MSSVPAVPITDSRRRSEDEDTDISIPEEPYHDEAGDEEQERPALSDNEEQQEESAIEELPAIRARNHSYEASVVSTQSNPPPYELYPPARTVFGRMFNWLRKIPTINTHQPIYLPTINNNENSSSGRSIFSFGRRHRRTNSSATLDNNSLLSSSSSLTDSVSCWSYYYFQIKDRLPDIPRFILPPFIAKYRAALICLSFFSLALFSFLLFCSVYFSPITYPDPIYPDKVTNTSARFLTLNIFMRPPLIKNNWSDYKDDRLAYIEKYILPEYDIIAFQESFAFASRRKDRLITTARNMGYNYHIESPRKYPWQIGVDGGLLIISRFPIRQTDIIEYPRGQHSDWLSIKGALHALIELNATRKMHLYTSHTQASYDLNNIVNEDDTIIRLSQFALLHSFVAETAGKDNEPIMIVGDLNVDAAIHPKGVPITKRLKDSSPEYVKMVDVIKGTGVLKRPNSSDERWFEHPWKMNDLRDVVYDHYGYHPVTFGDYKINKKGDIIPAETVLTNWDVLLTVQSIDRIFWSDRQTNIIHPQLPQVQKFWVEENDLMSDEEREQTKFTQISDHYGMSCEIKLN